MLENYDKFGDIIIVDATYRVNKYKLPLVLFTGFDYRGKNVLLGVAIVNDETEETYDWVFRSFFKLHLQRMPKIIVTDHDLAIQAVLIKTYPEITHILCMWHTIQNLKKNFSFLSAMKLPKLKDEIMKLPWLESKEGFDSFMME